MSSISMAGNVPNVSSLIRGIPPNNNLPLHNNAAKLLDLTRDEMLHVVLSNIFAVSDVQINTVIWKNFNIFSKRDYFWKVVRSRPECVKLLLQDGRICLCEPVSSGQNKYRALLLSKTLRARPLKSNLSLKEALDICEDQAAQLDNRMEHIKNSYKHIYDRFRNRRTVFTAQSKDAPQVDPFNGVLPFEASGEFKGLTSFMLDVEALSKAIIKTPFIQRDTAEDFEGYLYEQIHYDALFNKYLYINDMNERDNRLRTLRWRKNFSNEYFDILSALDLAVIFHRL